MTETQLDAQKRIEARRQYDQLTARIKALDTNIERSQDSEHTLTTQQARDDLAQRREVVAAELSRLGWDVANDHAAPIEQAKPVVGREPNYYRGLMTDEVVRQGDKWEAGRQLERLDGRLAMLSDEVARIRQDLAVSKVTTDGIRNDLKEKIDTLAAELYRMRGDLAVTKEAVLTVQNELRRLTEKLSAPPRGLSNNGIIIILVTGLIIIIVFVVITMYSLLRPI